MHVLAQHWNRGTKLEEVLVLGGLIESKNLENVALIRKKKD